MIPVPLNFSHEPGVIVHVLTIEYPKYTPTAFEATQL